MASQSAVRTNQESGCNEDGSKQIEQNEALSSLDIYVYSEELPITCTLIVQSSCSSKYFRKPFERLQLGCLFPLTDDIQESSVDVLGQVSSLQRPALLLERQL
jgi:hypothetical protein